MQPEETSRKSFVTHLECSKTGESHAAGEIHGLSRAGAPLLVRYDLAAISQALQQDHLAIRQPDLWRYREMLPVNHPENIVSLGETMTPLLTASRIGDNVFIKDEGRLPTGSFKARGLCMAVSMARELGLSRLAIPTNGNAGAAMAAYARRAGMEAFVFCPDDTPEINMREIALQGAKVWKVNGLITDCGKIVRNGTEPTGWFDVSTLKEPYRIEGKKTMGLELAEQFNWQLPDVILYPTGGGTGLIGMVKAFDELEEIGWIDSKRPRMVAVQASGCAPIVKAFDSGADHAEFWEDAHTEAAGIRVPAAVGDFLILEGIRKTGGFATAVDDRAIDHARSEAARLEGILLCPEGAATYAAYLQELESGRITGSESVVLFNCATGLKYPMPAVHNTLNHHKTVDYNSLV
ncbi:MAG: threonine synthase [Verrucomicrobiota bacterium]|nr:threonine synthase [Verrucomicrobiota bacterium]